MFESIYGGRMGDNNNLIFTHVAQDENGEVVKLLTEPLFESEVEFEVDFELDTV